MIKTNISNRASVVLVFFRLKLNLIIFSDLCVWFFFCIIMLIFIRRHYVYYAVLLIRQINFNINLNWKYWQLWIKIAQIVWNFLFSDSFFVVKNLVRDLELENFLYKCIPIALNGFSCLAIISKAAEPVAILIWMIKTVVAKVPYKIWNTLSSSCLSIVFPHFRKRFLSELNNNSNILMKNDFCGGKIENELAMNRKKILLPERNSFCIVVYYILLELCFMLL